MVVVALPDTMNVLCVPTPDCLQDCDRGFFLMPLYCQLPGFPTRNKRSHVEGLAEDVNDHINGPPKCDITIQSGRSCLRASLLLDLSDKQFRYFVSDKDGQQTR